MKKFYPLVLFYCFAMAAFGQAPPNDDCSAAIPVTAGVAVAFNTLEATTDGPFHPNSPCPSAVNDTLFKDVWYTFTPNFDGLVDFSLCNTANYDSKIAVYKPGTNCPAQDNDLLTCNDDGANCANSSSRLLFSVENGETYLLRVGGYGEASPGLSGMGTFMLSPFTPTLANDFCESAQTIMVGEDQSFTSAGATTDGPQHPGNNTCFGFGDPTVQTDIWYKFTAPASGSVQWSTCNSINFDSRMAIYNAGATCPLLDSDLLACNDDGSGCLSYTSKVFFNVIQGQSYLMRLGGYNGETGAGTFDLILSDPPPPPANDLCVDAAPVGLVTAAMADDFTGQTDGTTVDGYFDPNGYIFPNAQCFGTNTAGGEFSDVWYQFNSLGNTEIELRFYSGGLEEGSYYAELFTACDMPVDTSVIFGSCVSVNPSNTNATTLIGNLPSVPTIFLMRVTTRLTSQLPGPFFFFLVAENVGESAVQDDFPGSYQAFPNPAGDKLYLNLMLEEAVDATVSITNAFGQRMQSLDMGLVTAGDHQLDFYVDDMAPGVYFLHLFSEKGVGTVRFVKN